MQITFYGAAQTVTGSCYLLETKTTKILIDCGMFQGPHHLTELNRLKSQFDPAKLDFVLLTHAHADHSAMLPKLLKAKGYHALIHSTAATFELCKLIIPDSAHIQGEELDWVNRKRVRAGKAPVEAPYTPEEAQRILEFFVTHEYGEMIELNPEVSIRFRDAGHILGSSFIEVWVKDGNKTTKITFSGDVGNSGQAIVRDPEPLEDTDYLLIENTYANRCHKSREATVNEFREIIREAIKTKANIVIPAFAVERTQELLYELGKMIREKLIEPIPVYVDSPMAASATDIFMNHPECYDEEMRHILHNGDSPLNIPRLILSRTPEESRAINSQRGVIIISASGMAHAGRILHHLKHNLYKPENHILFVGFQVKGTLGRQILDGATSVKIMGEEIAVKAHIHTMGGFSAHADQDGLIRWLSHLKKKPKKIFHVHGEPEVMQVFADTLKTNYGYKTYIPSWFETVTLK